MLADNRSTIDSTLAVLTASVSVGSGQVNLSFDASVAVALNDIDGETLAGIDNSDVDAGGAVSIEANAGSTINANTVAVAISVAAGSGAVTLAGALAEESPPELLRTPL